MPWGCFSTPKTQKKRGPQPDLPLWHHKTRKSHQNEPKVVPKRDPKSVKNWLKTSSDSKGCLLEPPGQPRVTEMTPKVPNWPPRVPRIQVLGSKTAPKNAIVTPFQTPTPRWTNPIVPPSSWVADRKDKAKTHRKSNDFREHSTSKRGRRQRAEPIIYIYIYIYRYISKLSGR